MAALGGRHEQVRAVAGLLCGEGHLDDELVHVNHAKGEQIEDYNEVVVASDFAKFVQGFKDESLSINMRPGRVPQTTYWMIDAGGYAGRISIRHVLNENLLKLGGHIGYSVRPTKRGLGYGKTALRIVLPKAKALGITKALLTCDATNIASKKIIEGNGGVLENEVPGEAGKPNKLRYWITL